MTDKRKCKYYRVLSEGFGTVYKTTYIKLSEEESDGLSKEDMKRKVLEKFRDAEYDYEQVNDYAVEDIEPYHVEELSEDEYLSSVRR